MGDIYRPTIRMDDTFQKYVEGCFHASTLDRNQILRLMLFTAPLSAVYVGKLREYLKQGHDAPVPCWTRRDSALFLQQTWEDSGREWGRPEGISVKIGSSI